MMYASQNSENGILMGLGDAYKAKQAMTASTPGKYTSKDVAARMDELNIVTGHAYSVMKVDEKNRTITVQNPWSPDKLTELDIADFKAAFEYTRILEPKEK